MRHRWLRRNKAGNACHHGGHAPAGVSRVRLSRNVVGGNTLGRFHVFRAQGKLHNLETLLSSQPSQGTFAIGYTCWATHARPTEQKAHPHRTVPAISPSYTMASWRICPPRVGTHQRGNNSSQKTDPEIIPHLIEQIRKEAKVNGLPMKLQEALRRAVVGSWAHSI